MVLVIRGEHHGPFGERIFIALTILLPVPG
jgi:hypothetical protein